MFFCRDPVQGLDVIRSQSRNPQNFFFDWDALFDLLANTPEANYALCFLVNTSPVGWRFNYGYGCHNFKWVNKEGKFMYIKYHFLAKHV
ncbi:LOW QUALITY PROTEIN: catalase [Colletotrichum tofieldiae]|nr:LOW QUALITY PROTEIN: catalase [Colletotrichum tofieldiae]